MTNNKQQTAVEWYIEKLLDLDYEYAKGLITLAVWSERKKSLIEQAKEMEKQQIIEAFDFGDYCVDLPEGGWKQKYDSPEQYYEQTYGDYKQ
jgi:hypothetical protein